MSFGCIFCSSQAALWFINRGQVQASISTSRYADYTLGPFMPVPPVDGEAIAAERAKDEADLAETEPIIGSVLAPVPMPPRPTARPTEPTPIAFVTPTPTFTPPAGSEPARPPTALPPLPVPATPTPLPPPTVPPTILPQTEPTSALPTPAATPEPTIVPPTAAPTAGPTDVLPTTAPTAAPTAMPTTVPPATPKPTQGPTTSTPQPPTSEPPPNTPPPSPTALPVVKFSQANYSVNEGAGRATITVVLDKTSAQTVTVSIDIGGTGTAMAGSDYDAVVVSQLAIGPGRISQTFPITSTDDSLYEADETVELTLSNPNSGATLGSPASATLTIVDNDSPPAVQFDMADYGDIGESSGPAVITVKLTSPSGLTTKVDYASSNGTATAGEDYTGVQDTLTFDPNVTSQTFSVPITDDAEVEPSETLTLTLSNPVQATLGSPVQATLTITDDDQPAVQFDRTDDYRFSENDGMATITVTLTASPLTTATVEYATSGGTADIDDDYLAASGTITFAPGDTEETFSVSIYSDLLNELDETVSLTLSSPTNADLGSPSTATLVIEDSNDSEIAFSQPTYSILEADTQKVVTVTLSTAASTTITVEYSTNELTASNGQDYQDTSNTLTFSPGQTVMTFTVPITDDGIAEPDETIFLSLENPSPTSEAILGTIPTATLTITDDGDSSPCFFAPGATTDPAVDIGPPDGEVVQVSCQSAIVVDMGGPITTDGGSGFDFVFYEFEESGVVPLHAMTVKVAEDRSGPWQEVFNWGDNTVDANTNIGQAGHPAGSEDSPYDVPTTDLAGTTFPTGIEIDIDPPEAPAGSYRYVRFEALQNIPSKGVEIDAVQDY